MTHWPGHRAGGPQPRGDQSRDDVQDFAWGTTVGGVAAKEPAPETLVAKASTSPITTSDAAKFVSMPVVVGITNVATEPPGRALGLIPIELFLDQRTAAENIAFTSRSTARQTCAGGRVRICLSTGNPLRRYYGPRHIAQK